MVLLALGAACGRHPDASPTRDGQVHVLALPEVPPPDLPDAPGHEMLIGACSTCHTLRYIVDQPPLTRHQWAAEVDKMRHAYGAPFPDEMTAPIVEYLVTTHGREASR